jgi:hypothetical protein
MTDRVFSIWVRTNPTTDKTTAYIVTDRTEDPDDSDRAPVAEFPVSQLYDANSQLAKAQVYVAYMNKIMEATKTAYEQTMLMDILKK